jgi:pimeloyl-ACP methyl ester carboxylesterase
VRRFRHGCALVAAAVLAAACSSGNPQAADREDTSTPAPDATVGVEAGLEQFYEQRVVWEPCDGDFHCTVLRVPLDYDRPEGDVIDIAVLRSPATGGDRLGSLVVNPGGPGGSGLEYARAARAVVSGAVQERYDVVGFDPRGVGESTPVDCLSDDELDGFVATDASPDDEAEIAEIQAQSQALATGCAELSGELLPHVASADVARDLDVLRTVLGDEQLTYLGKSYGTFIGATYAELFPERVGRMVLDGALDPSLPGEQVAIGQAEGFERALRAYLEVCLAEECPLGRTLGEAQVTLDNLLAVIDAQPLPTDDDDRPLTQSLALLGMAMPLYLTPEQGYPALTGALAEALAGDGSGLLTLADLYLDRGSEGYNSNQNEAIYAVNCLDRPEASTIEEIQEAEDRFAEVSPLFGPYLAWSGLPCTTWPAESTATPGSLTAEGAAPILVVGTTGDPATPYEWAVSLADQLASGVLLTNEGFVHTAYRKGVDCVDDAVDRYLIEGEPPEDGLVCE